MGKICLIVLMVSFVSTGCSTLFDSLAEKSLYPFSSVNSRYKVASPPEGVSEANITLSHGNVNVWYKDNGKPVTIVYFHGNGENLEALKRMYTILSKLGNWVSFDYPGLGKSEGKPSQATLKNSGKATFDLAQEKFPDTKIVLWGWSLGAAVAMQVVKDSAPDRMILASAWSNLREAASTASSLSNLISDDFLKKNEYDSLAIAQEVSTRTLLLHGKDDKIIKFELGEKLSKAFGKDVVTFVPIEGYGHNDIMGSDTFWLSIQNFLD